MEYLLYVRDHMELSIYYLYQILLITVLKKRLCPFTNEDTEALGSILPKATGLVIGREGFLNPGLQGLCVSH